jgi:hypothetical protein
MHGTGVKIEITVPIVTVTCLGMESREQSSRVVALKPPGRNMLVVATTLRSSEMVFLLAD